MRNPDDTARWPRIQLGVLGSVAALAPGGYAALRSLAPATAHIVAWSSPDQAEPEMVTLRSDGVGERVDRPGGGYIGFACDPRAGELLISNATDESMEDVQVLGLRSSAPLAMRDPEPVFKPDLPELPAPPQAH